MGLKPAVTVESIINDRSQIRLSDIQSEFDGSTEALAVSIYELIRNGEIEVHPYNDVIRIAKTD